MRLISFDALQTLDIPGVRTVKPEYWFREKAVVQAADWILYPEYWQVNPLFYGLKKRIFPSVSTYHIGHDKVEMARAFEAVCPEHTPITRILPRTDHSTEQILDEFDFPFVAKAVRSSMGEGVFLITDKKAFDRYAAQNEILFVQEYLSIYRDLRVVLVGKTVVAAYWRQARDGGFCNNVSRGGTVCFENIPDSAIALVEKVAAVLDINHAGFDVAVVDGHPFFLEFNPRFGTRGLLSRGIRLGKVVVDYLLDMSRPPPGTRPSPTAQGRLILGPGPSVWPDGKPPVLSGTTLSFSHQPGRRVGHPLLRNRMPGRAPAVHSTREIRHRPPSFPAPLQNPSFASAMGFCLCAAADRKNDALRKKVE